MFYYKFTAKSARDFFENWLAFGEVTNKSIEVSFFRDTVYNKYNELYNIFSNIGSISGLKHEKGLANVSDRQTDNATTVAMSHLLLCDAA